MKSRRARSSSSEEPQATSGLRPTYHASGGQIGGGAYVEFPSAADGSGPTLVERAANLHTPLASSNTVLVLCYKYSTAQAAFQMLMLEHMDALAHASALAISNIKFDKVVVWENGGAGNHGQSNTTQFLQSLARSMPPMLQVMKDVGGVEVPEYLARLTGDVPTPPAPPAAAEPQPNGHPAAKG